MWRPKSKPCRPPLTAPPLSFVRGDANWTKYRKLALDNLYWFCFYVLGYGARIPMRERTHALLCKFVEKKTGHPPLDTAKYRKIEMPRETGKTTLVTQGYVVQRICANPEISILLTNEKEQNAKDFLSAIKYELENNELLRALFPELIPKDLNDTTWSASRIVVNRTSGRKEPTVFVIGEGGSVTGMHPDLIVNDDIISREAMENSRAGSKQIMGQVNRWINQQEPLLNHSAEPFPEIIFIGTRWWYNDSYEYIEQAFGYGADPEPCLLRLKLPNGEVQQLAPYRVGDLAVFRRAAIEEGRSIFPEKWSLEDLAKIRDRDPILYSCNYLNNPSDDATAVFREDWLHFYDMLDNRTYRLTDGTAAKRTYALPDLDKLMFVDPGGFGSRVGDDRMRAAIVVVGSSMNGEHLLLDIYSEKDTFIAAANKICEWAVKYTPRKLVIEQAGQQAAFIELVKRQLTEKKIQVTIEASKPGTKLKEQRILALEPYFQRGAVYLGKGQAFHEFREQYRTFPRSARLDVLDALAYLPQFARNRSATMVSPARRQQDELNAYYQKRGLTP